MIDGRKKSGGRHGAVRDVPTGTQGS